MKNGETGKTKKITFLFKIPKLSSNTKSDQYSDLWNLVIDFSTVNILKVSLKIRKKKFASKIYICRFHYSLRFPGFRPFYRQIFIQICRAQWFWYLISHMDWKCLNTLKVSSNLCWIKKKYIFQYLFSATSSNYFFRPYIKICINKTHYTARLSVCKMAVSLLSTNHKSFHGVFVFFQNKTSNAYEKYSISYILIVSSKA